MKKTVTIGVVLALLGGGGWFAWNWFHKNNETPAFREVQVKRGDLAMDVLATGIVEPQNRLELKPPIAGRVESILVEEGQLVQKGQVLAWLSSSERAALLDAARAKGAGEVAHWEELFKPTPLLAPLNGLIIVKNVVPGQVVTAADSVLVMSDHLIVNTQVDETDIGQIKLGKGVTVTLDAYPKDNIHGQVTRIAFESKTINNVTIYEVEILPEKVPEFMRSGMTANVRFSIDQRKGVLVLPVEAVKQEGKKASVLVPNPEGRGKPERREVQIGLNEGKEIEVLSGLKDGDTVLIPNSTKEKGAAGATNPFAPFGGGRPRGVR